MAAGPVHLTLAGAWRLTSANGRRRLKQGAGAAAHLEAGGVLRLQQPDSI